MTAVRHRIGLWLALVAMLLGALAPTVSQALAAQGRLVPLDVCFSGGVGGTPAPPSSPEGGSLLHGFCGYCLTHAGSFGLPAVSAHVALALPAHAERCPPPAAPVMVTAPWAPSLPRAPPAVG